LGVKGSRVKLSEGKTALKMLAARDPFVEFLHQTWRHAPVHRRGYLRKTMRYYMQALAADDAGAVRWFDELLAQRGMSVAYTFPGNVGLVRQYFELMPPAWLTVAVMGDAEVIAQRNREREKDDRSDITEWGLSATRLAVDTLRERGARVLALDAAVPAAENAARVLREVAVTSDWR
jgi:hypothetical protein